MSNPTYCSLALTSISWVIKGSSGCEELWKTGKHLPQYKYISKPIYKFFVSRFDPVIATAASFFITDLIAHQLLGGIGSCVSNHLLHNNQSSCDISWNPALSLAWVSLGIPVMYAKYKRSQEELRYLE